MYYIIIIVVMIHLKSRRQEPRWTLEAIGLALISATCGSSCNRTGVMRPVLLLLLAARHVFC